VSSTGFPPEHAQTARRYESASSTQRKFVPPSARLYRQRSKHILPLHPVRAYMDMPEEPLIASARAGNTSRLETLECPDKQIRRPRHSRSDSHHHGRGLPISSMMISDHRQDAAGARRRVQRRPRQAISGIVTGRAFDARRYPTVNPLHDGRRLHQDLRGI
jgi:hypothetical protein